MDFAADAVFDLAAPPPRSAAARPAPADTSEPSFDDHLEAASTEAAPQEESAKPSEPQKAGTVETKDESEAPDDAALAATTPIPTEAPAPQHIVQIVAPQATTANEAALEVVPESAPVAAAPVDVAPEAPPAPVTATPGNNAAKSAGTETDTAQDAKPDATGKSAPADTAPKTDASAAPTTNADEQAAQAQPTEQTAPSPTAPVVNETPPEMANVTPQPLPPEMKALATQRARSVEPVRGAKAVDAASEVKADAPAMNAPQTAKSASVAAAGKNSDAQIAPIQADTLDAPAPAQQTQSGTPTLQPAAQSQHASNVDHANAARAAPAAAQVAREIVRRFDGENTRLELRLDPPELGRVEVRLDVSRDHRVTAVIAADSPQALTELARHARDLEQMLQSSGLELTDNGLSFDLRQGGEGSADAESAGSNARAGAANEEAQQQQTSMARPLGYERWRGVRVDVMV